jgi:hypothetical protein
LNVYCDESCHLENALQGTMILGAVWCPLEKEREISTYIREINKRYDLNPEFEIKWTRLSPAKIHFSLELIDYLFGNESLHFRGFIVADKFQLQHEVDNQTHHDWYYKMYFTLLKLILSPQADYRTYLDVKDTQVAKKVVKLHDVLSNNLLQFSPQIIEKLQTVSAFLRSRNLATCRPLNWNYFLYQSRIF